MTKHQRWCANDANQASKLQIRPETREPYVKHAPDLSMREGRGSDLQKEAGMQPDARASFLRVEPFLPDLGGGRAGTRRGREECSGRVGGG